MGFWHSTYHFFGVQVPREKYATHYQWSETDRLKGIIHNTPGLTGQGLGYITAGDYDRNELFLCLVPDGEDISISLGSFKIERFKPHDPVLDHRAELIRKLARAAGYEGLADPGWVTVPDCS